MHGLNVIQVVDSFYLAGSTTTNTASSQARQMVALASDTPTQLAALGIFDGNTQYYFKRITAKRFFNNTGPTPAMMEIVHCRSRKDIPVSGTWTNLVTMLIDLLSDGIPITYAYTSPLTSNQFQRMFKITKTKKRIHRPGRQVSVRIKSYVPNKPYTQQIEANSGEWIIRKGSKLVLVFYSGLPYVTTNYTGTLLGNYLISYVDTHYYSFYSMNDTEPTSTVTSSLGLTRSSGLQATVTQTESQMFLQYIANQDMPNPAPVVVVS